MSYDVGFMSIMRFNSIFNIKIYKWFLLNLFFNERPTWATLANGASSIGLAIGVGSTGVVVARVQRAAEHKH
jgi:hypothetical protein